ncbi:Uncharacterised protein [Weissella viridescens]|uniref:Uncharacterized protein n=1 Tax=Weissella viridescens TaxID=1629 RepID=A0A380NWU6_WEIVI|nr:Uncharacterised protein [Weissella viridescens]
MIPTKDLQKTTGYVHGANNPVGIWQNKNSQFILTNRREQQVNSQFQQAKLDDQVALMLRIWRSLCQEHLLICNKHDAKLFTTLVRLLLIVLVMPYVGAAVISAITKRTNQLIVNHFGTQAQFYFSFLALLSMNYHMLRWHYYFDTRLIKSAWSKKQMLNKP